MNYTNIRISSAVTHFRSLFVSAFSFIKMLILGVLLIRAILIDMNPLNAELNPICPLLALFGAHHILHVSK